MPAAAHRLREPGAVALERRHEPRREGDGERRPPREARRGHEPVMVDEQRVGGEGERHTGEAQGAQRRDPELFPGDVEDPSTGTDGPDQITW